MTDKTKTKNFQITLFTVVPDSPPGVVETQELQACFAERLEGVLRRLVGKMGWQAVRLAGNLPPEFGGTKNRRAAIAGALVRAPGHSLLTRAAVR
ncbi:hypothetical protein TBH_C0746 [Thiolapillus brandeum]|uniref:Uncharacterized protein n=1 Tax=Thiolapillus brandeum TaxID=1076588 RepID=A0A7U6GHD3_9GAMM|nr:hypothetical protein TBH_C0746 [Thiolapillus brandeum]